MNEIQARNRMKQKSSQEAEVLRKKCGRIKENPSLLDSFNQMSLGLKQVVNQWSQSAKILENNLNKSAKRLGACRLSAYILAEKLEEVPMETIDSFLTSRKSHYYFRLICARGCRTITLRCS